MGTVSVSESSKKFSNLMQMSAQEVLIEFYRHKTSKHVSADVLDSEEGHQQTPPDQTYDVTCRMAYDSTGMLGISLRVVCCDVIR